MLFLKYPIGIVWPFTKEEYFLHIVLFAKNILSTLLSFFFNLLFKAKISLNEEKKKLFPILREDGTTLYYEILDDGIYRVGKKFLKEKSIKTESKRMVLPIPLTLEKTWNVDSETYLILRKYPYYDYRATTNFKLNYKVASMKETVNTPSGTFKDCILIIGNGETNFIGNNEIGSIGIKIYSKEWYSKAIGLIKMERIEETDTDLFGTTKMVQLLESYQKF